MLKNKVDMIMDVGYIEKSKLGSKLNDEEYNSLIVIEDKGGARLVYNLSTGEDLSFEKNLQIAIFEGVTKFLTFYKYEKEDFNTKIEVGKINNIKLYKQCILKNTYSNVSISCSDFLEFNYDDKKIIVDYVNNKLYINDNVEIIEEDKKCKTIFEIDKPGKSIYGFLLKRIRFLKLLYTFVDVEVV